MRLRIISKAGEILDSEAKRVVLPAVNGEMEILPMHAASMIFLNQGKIFYDDAEFVAKNGGIVEVNEDKILILLDEPR